MVKQWLQRVILGHLGTYVREPYVVVIETPTFGNIVYLSLVIQLHRLVEVLFRIR